MELIPLEPVRVPFGAQSHRAFCDRSDFSLSRQTTVPVAESQPAGAEFRALDEPGDFGHGRGLLAAVFGVLPYLMIQLTAMAVAGSAGVWLFYVQHQFEDVYWERGTRWDITPLAAGGQLVLQAAKDFAVVFRQHRVPPHPSFELADSKLQPGEMPPSASAVPEREAFDAVFQLEVVRLPLVG